MLERIVVIDYSVDFEITQIEKNFTIMVPNLACTAAKAVRSQDHINFVVETSLLRILFSFALN